MEDEDEDEEEGLGEEIDDLDAAEDAAGDGENADAADARVVGASAANWARRRPSR